jgi:hypothetical protein
MDFVTRRCKQFVERDCWLYVYPASLWFRSFAVECDAAFVNGTSVACSCNFSSYASQAVWFSVPMVRAIAVKCLFFARRGLQYQAVDNDMSLALAILKSTTAFLGSIQVQSGIRLYFMAA